ncbi:MAG: hypothetical protein ILO68_00775, partial [Clostridia bacterium]|nr:hypothetical protein [Clostridia bacterium]
MKKLLAILLVLTMLFALAACTETPTESSQEPAPATSSEEPAPVTSSEEPAPEPSSEEPAPEPSSEEPAPDTSSEEPAPDNSSEEPVSTETSDETSENPVELEIADFISTASAPYVSWSNPESGSLAKGGLVSVRSSNPTSVKLTAVNEGAVDGTASLIAFNRDYGKTIKSKKGSYDQYAVFVFEYNDQNWHYEKVKTYEVGKANGDIKIPSDGFILAVHEYFSDYINALKNASDTDAFYPHGFRGTNDVDTVAKPAKNIVIDGAIDKDEWGKPAWIIEPGETICSYEQFPKDDYYSTAEAYLAYDSEYIYIGVVVHSPNHYNPSTASNATGMWQYECIQVNVASCNPLDPYILEHFDWHIDGEAADKGVVRQYGFCVNNAGETVTVLWIGGGNGKA